MTVSSFYVIGWSLKTLTTFITDDAAGIQGEQALRPGHINPRMRKGPLITKQTFAAWCPWTAPIFARPERLAQDVLSFDPRASDSPRRDDVLEAGRCRPRVYLDFATGKSPTFLLTVVWCGVVRCLPRSGLRQAARVLTFLASSTITHYVHGTQERLGRTL